MSKKQFSYIKLDHRSGFVELNPVLDYYKSVTTLTKWASFWRWQLFYYFSCLLVVKSLFMWRHILGRTKQQITNKSFLDAIINTKRYIGHVNLFLIQHIIGKIILKLKTCQSLNNPSTSSTQWWKNYEAITSQIGRERLERLRFYNNFWFDI